MIKILIPMPNRGLSTYAQPPQFLRFHSAVARFRTETMDCQLRRPYSVNISRCDDGSMPYQGIRFSWFRGTEFHFLFPRTELFISTVADAGQQNKTRAPVSPQRFVTSDQGNSSPLSTILLGTCPNPRAMFDFFPGSTVISILLGN
jgi:hypothetical protein